ncbi:MAG: hypothetical protein HQL10_04140 [Nitrospirae bacterium]|nr:hypothetical protein [Nitrospirota bacterium]
MIIDARGLGNPNHIKKFVESFDGVCTVYDDIQVMLDCESGDLKKFEMYLKSHRCMYSKELIDGAASIKIEPPFSLC